MKTKLIIVTMAAAFLVGLASLPSAQSATEDAKKTKKSCTYCHVKVGKPDLNDAGKCYKEKGSLDDC